MTAIDTLHLRIDREDGSLQRLVGLIERRGFHIDGLTLVDDGDMRRLALRVRGHDAGRRPETLARHIDKLFGVTRLVCGHEADSESPDGAARKMEGR